MCFSTLHTLITMSNFMFSYLRQCHSFANKSCYRSLRRVKLKFVIKICQLSVIRQECFLIYHCYQLQTKLWTALIVIHSCIFFFPKTNSIEWGTVVLHDLSKFYIYPFGFTPHCPGPGPTTIHTNTNFFIYNSTVDIARCFIVNTQLHMKSANMKTHVSVWLWSS